MKQFFRFFMLATLCAGLSIACSVDDESNDVSVDTAPLVISIQVLDLEGHSVLNDQNIQNISATYKGESYVCRSKQQIISEEQSGTRYYKPHFYGLTYVNDYLIFGELDGTKTYTDEQLILYWGGDFKPDTITFSYTIQASSSKTEDHCLLNGQPVTGQIIIHKDLPTQTAEKNDSTPRKQMPISKEQFALIKQVNTFGTNLFREIVKEKQNESTVASPLSVAYLLGMIANGAREDSETAQQLLHVLMGGHGTDKSLITGQMPVLNNLFQTLITWASEVDNRVKLEIADAFFTNEGFPVYAGYVDLLAQYYHADYAKLDFASPEALNYINDWSSQKTHGLIPKILNEIPGDVVAYLFNALYFKAPWTVSFNKEYTSLQDFTLPNGSKRQLYLMHNYLKTLCAQTGTYTAVSLPFAQGAYWMDIILPTEGISTTQLAQDFDFQQIPWNYGEVVLTLPRFEVSSDFKRLNDQLRHLGITRIFTQEADLTQLSPVDEIFVSRIFQKARIIINEEGGEAAAVSGASLTESMDPNQVYFTANRPFLYCIREVSSGAIFFIGTYCGDEQ